LAVADIADNHAGLAAAYADALRNGVQVGRCAAQQKDFGAGLGQQLSGRCPDASTCAGYQGGCPTE
jgi:hypothetical protein